MLDQSEELTVAKAFALLIRPGQAKGDGAMRGQRLFLMCGDGGEDGVGRQVRVFPRRAARWARQESTLGAGW
jgi:hypothetical protein